MLQEIIDEFAALGWRAVFHGPEAHLALPLVYTSLAAILIVIWSKNK